MNSPLSGDTASSRRLFSVFMRCWQTGREAGSTSTGTTSHWQRETRLEVLELPFSWPPFPFFLATLRPLPQSSPPSPLSLPVQRHIAGGGKPWLLCAHHFTPTERPVLTHWPDINASNHRPSHFEQCRSSILACQLIFLNKFFSRHEISISG